MNIANLLIIFSLIVSSSFDALSPQSIHDKSSENINKSEAEKFVLQQVAPPTGCNSRNITVINPDNKSSTLEAVFCESATDGVGDLYIINYPRVAHVLQITAGPGVENVLFEGIVTYGPNYWTKVLSDVRLHPGQYINITATKFGTTNSAKIAAFHAHVLLLGELLLFGSVPTPNASFSEELSRYLLSLYKYLPSKSPEWMVYDGCLKKLQTPGLYQVASCLYSVAGEQKILSFLHQASIYVGKEIAPELLSSKFAWFLKATKNMIDHFVEISEYLFQLGDTSQDVAISLFYTGSSVPRTSCLNCPENAIYLEDLTLPDGVLVSPNQILTKTWRMQNTGMTTWGSGYALVFTSGDQMGAPAGVSLPGVVAPGQTVDISVPIKAPASDGNYQGNFRLRNPQGTYFGQTIWVKLTVKTSANPTPPSNPADWDVAVQSVEYPTVVTPSQTFRPRVTVKVNQGQLLASRGDLLRNTDGNLFGAWPHVSVVGTVNTGQTYTFEFYADNPIHAPTGEGSYDSRWRVWRDGNWAGPEIVIHFDVRNGGGERPAVPTIASPGNWSAFLQGNTPSLCANAVSGVQYYFQIYESHDIPESGWTSNCWTPPGLGPYTYKWHVKARNPSNGLESDWSESRYFTLNSNELSMSNLEFSPGSPSASENIRVYTCVSGFGGIGLGLKIEANTATDGSAKGDWYWIHHLGKFCYDHANTSTWPTWEDLPLADGQHLIRAVGYGPQGQTLEKTAVFTLNRRRPSAPRLLSPSADEFLKDAQVTFRWSPSYRVNNYRLLVSTNSNPTVTPMIDQTLNSSVTEYTTTFSTAYPHLYWRVVASNELGTTESTGHFSLDWAAPASSVVPFGSTTGYEPVFTVTWGGSDNLSGIRWYDVQYRDGNRPDSVWTDWMTQTSTISAIFTGQAGHVYYFRSRAMDKAANIEEWPDSPDGDTFMNVDISSRPPTPWWDANYAYKRNLVILNNDSKTLPIGYPVLLHFDNNTSPTAAFLYTASQSPIKGDDFRIVQNDSTEVPRFIQTFSSDSIDIWFNLISAIAKSPGSDSMTYQLYYGNPSVTIVSNDPNLVFSPSVDGNTVGLWRYSEGNGLIIADSSGHSYNGTATNLGWATGKFGWSGLFNGINSYVNLGSLSAYNLNKLSLEAWVKFSQLNAEISIFRKEAGDTSIAFDALSDYNKIVFRLNGGSCTLIGNTTLTTGRWYHIAWVYDGNTASVFLNGQLDGTLTCGQTLRIGQTPLWMGGDPRSLNKWLKGNIQLARLSNTNRSSFSYGAFSNVLVEPSVAAGYEVQPPIPGTPDLVIQSLQTYPNADGGVTVVATVYNQGSADTRSGFYTDLYLDHMPTGVGDYTGSFQFWVNDPIPAGAAVTLTSILPAISPDGANGTAVEAKATLYAQTDSAGAVSESEKDNNIYSEGTEVCFASTDAFESDQAYWTAPLISEGQTQQHNFDRIGDQDWIKFNAVAGKTYPIHTFNLGEYADTVLSLYAPDGTTLLASNDDYGGKFASQIVWTAPADGTYYVLVKQWNPNTGGCGTQYSVGIRQTNLYFPVIGH